MSTCLRKHLSCGWEAAVTVFALLGLASVASGQDSHYWSVQYGPVAQLVGGQVIGGVPDLSATFYNPGALALRNESSYLLSTESFQLEMISTSGASGRKLLDTSSSTFGAAPSLIAGVLPAWFGKDTRLAWSFLTRQKLDVRLGVRLIDPLGAPFTASAAESYFDQRLTENWGGLTISHPFGESLGVGVTLYGTYRGQKTRRELSAQAVANDGRALAASGVWDFDYATYGGLAKLGLAWQRPDWNAGLSITTPRFNALGTGTASRTISVSGVDAAGLPRPAAPLLEADLAEDVDAIYRSSWAVGAGGSYQRRSTRFYVSAEWFAPVEENDVLALGGGFDEDARLTQEAESVLNAGLGVEHVLNQEVSIYGAFHTDFSASTGGARSNVAVTDWNLYHLSGGTSFQILENRFTLGASWAFGSKPRMAGSVPGVEAALGDALEVRYSKVTFLLGYVFGR